MTIPSNIGSVHSRAHFFHKFLLTQINFLFQGFSVGVFNSLFLQWFVFWYIVIKMKKLTGPSSCFGRKRILPSKALADPKKSLWAFSSLHLSFLLSISGLQVKQE